MALPSDSKQLSEPSLAEMALYDATASTLLTFGAFTIFPFFSFELWYRYICPWLIDRYVVYCYIFSIFQILFAADVFIFTIRLILQHQVLSDGFWHHK